MGEPVLVAHLTPVEVRLVSLLETSRDHVVTYEQLVTKALGYVHAGEHPRVLINKHASNLRKKGVCFSVARGRGLYMGIRPLPEPAICSGVCKECGAEFSYQVRQGRPFRYCEDHRGRLRDQRRYVQRKAGGPS